jgi:outer membrane protein assembly factor BamB
MMVSRFWLAVFVFSLVFSTAVAPILAVDNWPNYGRDPQHSGRNEDATGYDPTQFRPVWVFPRSGGGGPTSGEEKIIDDLIDFNNGFTASPGGAWGVSTDLFEPADDSYANRYIYSRAVLRNDTNTATAVFNWTLAEPGTYYIDVWFPSSMNAENALKNTQAAVYIVYTGDPRNAATKAFTFRIDQRTGGEWVRLRPQAFELGAGATVVLTNLTADAGTAGREDVLVVADAVRFVPTTGIEIYASPIADKAYVAPENMSLSIPVAYAATVETAEAYGAVSTDDLGAVYCIYSYVGYTMPPSGNHEASIEWQRIGRPAWRYPKHPAPGRWGELEKTFQREVIPIEGPIEGGIYSTPTLAGDKIVFAGVDRQIYCVQASGDRAGQLIWKGPGITVSEPESVEGWTQVGDPKNDLGRGDAFGHKFLSIAAGSGNSITWMVSFPPDGLYSVYAWLPDKIPGEVRVSRAKYTITYDGGSSEVIVDQQVSGNSGTWIKLGESYWRASRVELSPAAADSEDAGKQVVADAVMFIPAELEAFSYSSPIVANNRVYVGNTNGRVYALDLATGALVWVYPTTQKVQRPGKPSEATAPPLGAIVSSPAYDLAGVGLGDIYVSSMDGGLYKLDAGNGSLVWQYPEEGKEVAEDRAFTSSPMIFGDFVYIGGTNGRLYAINKETGKPRWVRPINEEDPSYVAGSSIVEVPMGAIRYSTPAHDPANRNVLIGSTDGYVYAFKENTGAAAWGTVTATDYRDSAAHVFSPVQAAVSLDATRNVYAATMDGAVWWLNADNGMFRTEYMDSGMAGYAVDGTQVFASPGVANRYMYSAWSSGHLIAFSWRGTGGAFGDLRDDELPGYEDAPGAKIEKPVAAERPEVNIFEYVSTRTTITAEATIDAIDIIVKGATPYRLGKTDTEPGGFFNSTLCNFRGNPATDSIREAAHKHAWRSLVGTGASQLFLEWGEKVYLIAWNLNSLEDISGGAQEFLDPGWTEADIRAKRNNVTFTFNNSTPGPAAGQMANSKHADYLVEYELTDLDEDGNAQYRSLAICVVDVGRSKRNPPAPGYGWRFSVNTRLRSVSGGRAVSLPSSVPELSGSRGSFTPKKDSRREQIPQRIGVNNPLAIRDDQDFFGETSISLAWSRYLRPPRGNRDHPEAHFNGNGGVWINPDTGEIEPPPDPDQNSPWVNEKYPLRQLRLHEPRHELPSRLSGSDGPQCPRAEGRQDRELPHRVIRSSLARWMGTRGAVRRYYPSLGVSSALPKRLPGHLLTAICDEQGAG